MKNRSAKAASETALVISVLLWLVAALAMLGIKDVSRSEHQYIVTGVMLLTAVLAAAFTTSIKPIRNGARLRTIAMMIVASLIAAALWVVLMLAVIDGIRTGVPPLMYVGLLIIALPAAMFSAFAWHCSRSLSFMASQSGQRGFVPVTAEQPPNLSTDLTSSTDRQA